MAGWFPHLFFYHFASMPNAVAKWGKIQVRLLLPQGWSEQCYLLLICPHLTILLQGQAQPSAVYLFELIYKLSTISRSKSYQALGLYTGHPLLQPKVKHTRQVKPPWTKALFNESIFSLAGCVLLFGPVINLSFLWELGFHKSQSSPKSSPNLSACKYNRVYSTNSEQVL